MFRRKPRSKTSFLVLHSSNRGSDIVRPENTSLIVNESDSEDENLPKELTSIFSEDEESDVVRKSSSLMRSLSQKTQSTPLCKRSSQNKSFRKSENRPNQPKILRNVNNLCSPDRVSYFEEVLKACGASPLPGNSSFLMTEDQAVFSIKINDKLKEKAENLKKFVSALREKLKKSENLEKMLAHTLTSESCEVARGPVQEPMMRMLLNVDCIKADLIELLLSLVADLVTDNKVGNENVQLISSILHQMRFLSGTQDFKISSKLFEIIHVAPINIKREIIFLFPEIISEEETEDACIQLIDLLKFDETLTHVIVDAVAHLPLNKSLRLRVCSKIMNRLDKCPLEFLPTLVQFVLHKCSTEELNDVINGLRMNLPFTAQHHQMKEAERNFRKNNSDDDSYVKLTFENFKFSNMASKQMTETWIKLISGLDSSVAFRCVDLAMLIIFYSCLHGRKNQILLLVRSKIKSGVLTCAHVQNLFTVLAVITQEYCSAILEIASALLKSVEPKISNFGSFFYKECFIHFNFYMRQIVISEILLHIGTGAPATVNIALSALEELCIKEKEALSKHTTSIMGLLVKVEDLDLMQVRLLMNVITDLVFFESSASKTAVYDELLIFIRKQLISSKPEQCKKGVTAAVVFAKHSGKEENFKDEDRTEINSLLELAMGSNGMSECKRGFFNDEFASMSRESQLSESFLEFWSKSTSSFVMGSLFVKNIDLECADFPMSLQYSLSGEKIEKLVVPIVGFVIQSKATKLGNFSPSLIPSTLRLLWCLERNVKRNLPAFYAAVIMPDSNVYENFKRFDVSKKKKIMDCLFLCGNYLIESINALCVYGIMEKAVIRIKQLISVRKLIASNLNEIADYVPPFSQFYSTTHKVSVKKKTFEKKPGRKARKRKIDEVASETIKSFIETPQSPGTSATRIRENILPNEETSQEADLRPYSDFFREIDFEAHKLLAANSNSKTNSRTCREATNDLMENELNICEVLFLLEDLLHKSEQILKSTEITLNFKNKPVSLLAQKMTPVDFIAASMTILPHLLNKIEIFSERCESLLEANDWIYDSQGLYVAEATYVKLAMAAGLNFISEIVCWRGFQNACTQLFKELLSLLKRRENSNRENEPTTALAIEAANYLASFSKTVLVLSGALSIVKSFEACLQYSSCEPCSALADLCYEFLCRKWFTTAGTVEKGSAYNHQIDYLLKTYFSHADNKLMTLGVAAKTALDEVGELGGKDSTLKTFKTINKSNFPLLYRTLCEALVSSSSKEFCQTNGNSEKQLEIWSKIVEILLVLVETSKILPSRIVLASLLKRSQSIIQLFLNKGIPLVESALRVKSVEVLTLLKSFQVVTRFLHSICCHSRITNDSLVANYVPAIRSQCERLTLEVKGMLILNGIPMECITIAILKNRDIKGNDIISQETLDENSDDESELPPEDTPDDAENDEKNTNEEAKESDTEAY